MITVKNKDKEERKTLSDESNQSRTTKIKWSLPVFGIGVLKQEMTT